VVAVVFLNVFRAKIHRNNVFFIFLKIIFKISKSKRFKTHKKKLIFISPVVYSNLYVVAGTHKASKKKMRNP